MTFSVRHLTLTMMRNSTSGWPGHIFGYARTWYKSSLLFQVLLSATATGLLTEVLQPCSYPLLLLKL